MTRNTCIFLLTSLFMMAGVAESCKETPYTQGKILYENFCENCHMRDGSGLEGLIPPLAGADFLKHNPEKIPCIIRKGLKEPIVVNGQTYDQEMSAVPNLSDFEITNVINYINSAWGNDYGYVKLKDVRRALETCPLYE